MEISKQNRIKMVLLNDPVKRKMLAENPKKMAKK